MRIRFETLVIALSPIALVACSDHWRGADVFTAEPNPFEIVTEDDCSIAEGRAPIIVSGGQPVSLQLEQGQNLRIEYDSAARLENAIPDEKGVCTVSVLDENGVAISERGLRAFSEALVGPFADGLEF